jgi:hypothetical protein
VLLSFVVDIETTITSRGSLTALSVSCMLTSALLSFVFVAKVCWRLPEEETAFREIARPMNDGGSYRFHVLLLV